jgi:hypothetical protein
MHPGHPQGLSGLGDALLGPDQPVRQRVGGRNRVHSASGLDPLLTHQAKTPDHAPAAPADSPGAGLDSDLAADGIATLRRTYAGAPPPERRSPDDRG